MATPTRIQHNSAQLGQGNALDSYTLPGTSVVRSGNSAFVFVQCAAGSSPDSVTDDKGNSYTLRVSNTGDPNQRQHIYERLNITNGPRIITVHFASATPWVSVHWVEFLNILSAAATDGSASGSGTSTTPQTSAFTPGTDGDLVLAYFVQDGVLTDSTLWTPGASPNWSTLHADILDNTFSEYYIQPSHISITPRCTLAPSNAWGGVSAAYKNATQGTAATGMQVIGAHHYVLKETGTGGTTSVIQFPCSTGNLLVMLWNGAGGLTISSIADTSSNTWVKGGPDIQNPGSGMNQCFYCAGPTTSNLLKLTITHGTSAPVDTQIILLEIVNAAAVPYDTASDTATATGTDSDGSNITGASITPSTDNGLIFSLMGIASNNVIDNVGGSLFFGASTSPIIPTSKVDENQGPSIARGTSGVTLTNIYVSTGGAVGTWADKMVAFIEAPPVTLDNMNPATGAQGSTGLAITCTGTRFTGV